MAVNRRPNKNVQYSSQVKEVQLASDGYYYTVRCSICKRTKPSLVILCNEIGKCVR
jgi:hypothetical protein